MEGSRLIHSDILKNPKRRIIYEYICANPGVYHYLIMKTLNMPNHITIWHLDALSKFGFIKSHEIDRHLIYYDQTKSADQAVLNYLKRNEKSQKIMEYIQSHSGCSKFQIVNDLKMHPNTVRKYIDELMKTGMIIRKNTNKLHINISNLSKN